MRKSRTLYIINVSNRDTGEIYEAKAYWQYGRIAGYCNRMFRKYGERVYCEVFSDENLERPIEEWGA